MSWVPAAEQRSDRSGFQGSDSGSQSGQGMKEQYKIYVQNIPMDIQKESVEEFFSKCGNVVYTKLLEPKGGRDTVVGFISFDTEDAVEEAIQKMSGCSLGDGPPLRVMRPKAASNNNNQSGGGQTCHKCGEAGHFSRECPNNTSGGGQTCHKCGEAGHFSRECPSNTGGNNNRQTKDRNNRFGDGGSSGGNTYNNGPSFNNEKSPFRSNSANAPSSNSGYHGNQSDNQQSFRSMLGRGETRNSSDPPRPGQSSQNTSYPPLAPLRKDNQPPPVQNGGYEQQAAPSQHQQPPATQPQYQGHQPTQSYGEQPPSHSYQQPPDQGSGHQEQPLSSGYQYQQPGYQDPPQNQGYQQPLPGYQEQQQPAQGYQYNTPVQQGYQQPNPPQQQYQEQPPNHYQEQPPNQYQEQPPNQTTVQQGQQNYTGQQAHQNYTGQQAQQSHPGQQAQQSYPEQTPKQTSQHSYGEQPPQTSYNQQPPQQGQKEQPSAQSYPSHEATQSDATSTSQTRSWAEESFSSGMQNGSATVQEQSSWPTKSRDNRSQGGRGGGQTCHKCGEAGHFSRECPSNTGGGGQTCHKCGEAGHFSRECPSNTGGGGQTCHKCGEAGHFSRECPSNTGGGGQTCHKCGEAGHFSRECPSNTGGGGQTCHKCGEAGHFSRECPSNTGGGGQTCHKCGEAGHFSRECPSNTGGGGQTCHKCGEAGHFARECPSNTGDRLCHNCKEPGHFSRECPNPRQQGDQTCHKCGEAGHFARECPNNTGSSCHKCGEVGHFARECPNKSGPGDNQLCHRCGEAGHFSRDCSQSPNRGGPTCHRCGKVGHISKDCSESPTKEGGDGCHNCGKVGHFSRECPDGLDPSRPAPVTYIPEELPDDMEELFRDVPHFGINFDKYDNIPVKVSGVNEPTPMLTFEEANFGSQCKTNIRRAGFVKPTPVQKYTFPILLSGRDLMACAQTGSGKTVAYLLPTLTNIINNGLPSASRSPLVLCLAPTRELVIQIYKETRKFSDGTPVKVCMVYGGVSVAYQAQQLEQGCHFLAATPGRLQDFIRRERIYLDNIKYLILDEADRMLDMGFEQDIRKIVEQSNMTDKLHRQTLMFSATFPDEIQRLAWDFLRTDFLFLAVGRVGGSNLDIQQHVLQVNGNEKRDKLFEILNASGQDRTLVFVELKRVADFLACLLSENNFPTTSISSDRNQSEREAALRDFRNGRAYVMVATSVAARGLDIPDVKHVVNYDLPQDVDEYVHRIGRTGRIGNQGKATSFFEQGRDEKLARSLVKILSEACQDVPGWLEKVAEDAVGSSYGPRGGRFSSKDQREGGPRGNRNNYQNINSESMASSQFGSQAPAKTHNGPTPPQGTPSFNASRGATGDSDDDWD